MAFTKVLLLDAIGREAIAQTTISGRGLRLLIQTGISEEELSITLYHEVLEAVAVASLNPPDAVAEFNEAAFEAAARAAHGRWGLATPENLNRMLLFYGFREN